MPNIPCGPLKGVHTGAQVAAAIGAQVFAGKQVLPTTAAGVVVITAGVVTTLRVMVGAA
jgi:hypothetical protein